MELQTNYQKEIHQAQIGKCIAEFLDLRRIEKGEFTGQYKTTWGTKTDLGLYLCIKRILEEKGIDELL